MQLTKYAAVAVIAFVVSMLFTAKMIPVMKEKQFGQFIREDGPQAHLVKAGTPTMGGIAMIAGITVALIASSFITGPFGAEKLAILLSMYAFGIIGFIDDYNKIAKKQNEGLTPKQKLVLQVLFGIALAVFMMLRSGTAVLIPFTGKTVDFGIAYIPFVVFVEVAMANSVNLTDGLDGLASSTSAIVAACFAVIAIIVLPDGNEPMEQQLRLCSVQRSDSSYTIITQRGYSWETQDPWLSAAYYRLWQSSDMLNGFSPIAGLIFVCEALSVIIQVTYFKKTGGKRVFRMAPIHHHFELGGWHETKVVRVFCLFTLVCCIIAVLSVM